MTVAILDESFEAVFVGASIVDVSISDASMQQSQPVEKGDEKTDYVVFNPIEIDMKLSVVDDEYAQTYREIEAAYRSQTVLFVQTRVKVYGDMYIASIPHEETSKNSGGFTMAISFKEAMRPVVSVKYAPASRSDSSTARRGGQKGTEPNPSQDKKSSLLYRVFK